MYILLLRDSMTERDKLITLLLLHRAREGGGKRKQVSHLPSLSTIAGTERTSWEQEKESWAWRGCIRSYTVRDVVSRLKWTDVMNKPDAELYGSVRSMTVEGERGWADFVNENKHVRPCVGPCLCGRALSSTSRLWDNFSENSDVRIGH